VDEQRGKTEKYGLTPLPASPTRGEGIAPAHREDSSPDCPGIGMIVLLRLVTRRSTLEKDIVWIKWIGSHADYDQIDVKEVKHGG
jgi:hypothetical protein